VPRMRHPSDRRHPVRSGTALPARLLWRGPTRRGRSTRAAPRGLRPRARPAVAAGQSLAGADRSPPHGISLARARSPAGSLGRHPATGPDPPAAPPPGRDSLSR
jgi:hypothetical protein